MRRLALAVALAALLAGCPRGDQSKDASPATGGSAAAPGAPKPPRVGTVYVWKLLGGGVREDEVVAVGTATVTLSRTVGLSGHSDVETLEEPLAGPSPAAAIKPDMKLESTRLEVVTISGKEFRCDVRETLIGKTKLTEWVVHEWPHVIRTRSGPFVTLELAEIRPPKVELKGDPGAVAPGTEPR